MQVPDFMLEGIKGTKKQWKQTQIEKHTEVSKAIEGKQDTASTKT